MHGRTFRDLSACAALSVALLASRAVRAQESGSTSIAYRVPEGCPNVDEFQRSVQRRTARVHFVNDGAHDRELSIVIRKEGEATLGALRLVERDGRVSQRNVRFTTCAEAVEGLALIAVVSLDPQALLEPAPSPPRGAPSEPAAAASKPPEQVTKSQPRQDTASQGAGSAPPSSNPRFALGAAFSLAPSALPETAFGGSLFVDLASTSESPFAPLFRVALSHVERRGLSSDHGAEANFTLTLATLSACPLRIAGGFLDLRPCAFVSGGALYAWGAETTNLQQRTRPYGALGGSLLLLAHASQAIDIVADLQVGATLVRDTFGFEQDQPWKTPSLYLSSGIGARFVFR